MIFLNIMLGCLLLVITVLMVALAVGIISVIVIFVGYLVSIVTEKENIFSKIAEKLDFDMLF